MTYEADYVVVGAGVAGSVVAARLAQDGTPDEEWAYNERPSGGLLFERRTGLVFERRAQLMKQMRCLAVADSLSFRAGCCQRCHNHVHLLGGRRSHHQPGGTDPHAYQFGPQSVVRQFAWHV